MPVLVQATPDRSDNMTIAVRRDSFCGKMSCCNNMMQYGIKYSLTTLHTETVQSPEFKADLEWFSAVCRIVKGLKNLKIGSIGARPAAFNTVRYSERILETQRASPSIPSICRRSSGASTAWTTTTTPLRPSWPPSRDT